MSDEKPLHVRVAEAVGWLDIRPCGDIAAPWASGFSGYPPGSYPIIGKPDEGREKVPRFDLEWGATGPLIERFNITVAKIMNGQPDEAPEWEAIDNACMGHDGELWNESECEGRGPTPLHAVCALIVALAEAGKLRA